MMTKVVYRQHT